MKLHTHNKNKPLPTHHLFSELVTTNEESDTLAMVMMAESVESKT